MAFLTRIFAPRQFTLPKFDLPPLELSCPQDSDELLLDRVVAEAGGQSNVVTLAAPLPTAGELRASIERHLISAGTRVQSEVPPDPAEELRSALAELHRSLG